MSLRRHSWIKKHTKGVISSLFALAFIVSGFIIIWLSTIQIPDLSAFEARKVSQSTKIYDRTGEILLYDVHSDAKRTIVPFDNISKHVKDATISIEDNNFYNHKGIEPSAILRAIIVDITGGGLAQGGSTITQQVVKNSVLTKDKTITRKLKEWILSLKIERVLTKDQILSIYLNESPYGGNIYGVEEASRTYFGKSSKDLTVSESAYLAAIPQAPTFYSPYGQNKKKLDDRQRIVLGKMKELKYISEAEYNLAVKDKVVFLEKNTTGIRAPHFSMYVRDYLNNKYGSDIVDEGGLKVITTLDFSMQEKAEKVIRNFSSTLENQFNASNTAMVAINPKNGDILTMVGSRDYFDKKIDGNFNVATAFRQPGSTFKPFVYATAFMKGYTPDTVLFDVETEFSTQCTPEGKPKDDSVDPKKCYSPVEYDGIFEGPMPIREALAHSRNIPAVKTLYLAGIQESLNTAKAMGISSLKDPNRYGLTLVLGGGEVSLLELTSAYGVFANDGVRNKYRSILRVEDSNGKILEEAVNDPSESIQPQIARQITDILSDTKVRMSSLIPVGESLGGRPVAIKTGTTNDFRDVWIEGYTPNLVVGAWAGKNDNTPMDKKVAGLIIAPVWGAFMAEVNPTLPREYFKKPETAPDNIKPTLKGKWEGGIAYSIDTVSGKRATQYTPKELKKDIVFNSVHTILHWVSKDDPLGEPPTDPKKDSQYEYWEYGVQKWFTEWKKKNPGFTETTNISIPTETDDVHIPENFPKVNIESPTKDMAVSINSRINVSFNVNGKYPLKKAELYINDKFIASNESGQKFFSINPNDIGLYSGKNDIRVVVYDTVLNRGESETSIDVSN